MPAEPAMERLYTCQLCILFLIKKWVETYGVIGMLDRIRDPSVADRAPSLRGVAPMLSFFEAVVGVSSTRRRNCWLFILSSSEVDS